MYVHDHDVFISRRVLNPNRSVLPVRVSSTKYIIYLKMVHEDLCPTQAADQVAGCYSLLLVHSPE